VHAMMPRSPSANDGREQQHQCAQAIDAEVILDAQRRNPADALDKGIAPSRGSRTRSTWRAPSEATAPASLQCAPQRARFAGEQSAMRRRLRECTSSMVSIWGHSRTCPAAPPPAPGRPAPDAQPARADSRARARLQPASTPPPVTSSSQPLSKAAIDPLRIEIC
jgi:hypothetical protein